MTSANIIVLCLLILAGLHLVLTSSTGGSQLYEVDVCNEDNKLTCKARELISIVDLTCGSGSGCSHDVNKTIFDLCQGHQTCSTLGLTEMTSAQCGNNVTVHDSLRVKFTCIPGSTSSCRSNICSESSQGLTCPEGSLVHIRRMTCGSLTEMCSLSTYTNMYVCEGVEHCAASGLKTLLPQNCQREVGVVRTVIVQYFCVPDRQIESTCTSDQPRVLNKDFGIVRSPHRDTIHIRSSCRWIINTTEEKKVKVIVHLITAKVTQNGCDSRVLNITFVGCKNRSMVTMLFCNISSSRTELTSCGQVLITSTILHGQESADKFIVSYQTYSSSTLSPVPDGLPSCLAPPETSLLEAHLHPTTPILPVHTTSLRPSVKSSSIGRNYGPGDGMFEYRDSLYDEDVAETDNSKDSSSISKQLKLMILYIFFGVVIFVLVVALVAVIISYHRLSKFKGRRVNSSEKTVLWKHNDDTPLEIFHNVNLTESSGTLTTDAKCVFKTRQDTDQVVATVHHDAVSEQDETTPSYIGGNSFSTFLTGKRESDCKDLPNNVLSCSLTRNASCDDDVSNAEQKVGNNNIEDGGCYEIGDNGHYDMPIGCEHNIYEVIDLHSLHNNKRKQENNHSHYIRPDTPTDSINGDIHYKQTNYDPAIDGLQNCPSNDLHYCINNDEYAVVNKAGKSTNVPITILIDENQQNLANHSPGSGSNIHFRPTSGPYDKKRNSADNSSGRWSKGDSTRWTDEV